MDEANVMSSGEVYRSLTRIEGTLKDLTAEVRGMTGPFSELKVKVNTAEEDINALGNKVTSLEGAIGAVRLQAAGIAGGVVGVAGLIKLLWK